MSAGCSCMNVVLGALFRIADLGLVQILYDVKSQLTR